MANIPLPETNLPRIVIIGGGFAGIELIKSLKKEKVQIILLDRHNYHTFQPLLYQVATGGLEPDSIATPFRTIFEGYTNLYFRMAEVKTINREKKCVSTNIGDVKYDYLVIATGSRTNYFGIEGLRESAMPLKTIPQALDLRSLMLQNFEKALLISDLEERNSRLNIVVVGGGPTGVEISGALAELKTHVLPHDYPELDFRKMSIYLIEANDRVLAGMSERSSAKSKKFLENLGVEVWTGISVKNYEGRKVLLSNGKTLQTHSLIWTAGVMGNLVDGLTDITVRGNRIDVDEFLSVRNSTDVFALGDCAGISSDTYPNGLPGVAPVAVQQGQYLGKRLKSIFRKKEVKPFRYTNKGTMATVGRNKAVVDMKGFHTQGFLAWWIWMFVHIMYLVSFRNRLVVLVNWMWNYMSYDKAIRLIIRPYIKGRNSRKD